MQMRRNFYPKNYLLLLLVVISLISTNPVLAAFTQTGIKLNEIINPHTKNMTILCDPFPQHFEKQIRSILKQQEEELSETAMLQFLDERKKDCLNLKATQIAEDNFTLSAQLQNSSKMTLLITSCDTNERDASAILRRRHVCKTDWYWLEANSTNEMEIKNLKANTHIFTFASESVLESKKLYNVKTPHRLIIPTDFLSDFKLVEPFALPTKTQPKITQCYNSTPTHTGPTKYAVDFGNFPEWSPVINTREGIVVQLDYGSEVSCQLKKRVGEKFWVKIKYQGKRVNRKLKEIDACKLLNKKRIKKGKEPLTNCNPEKVFKVSKGVPNICQKAANKISIRHPDGTVSSYIHLAPFGNKIKFGTDINIGSLIPNAKEMIAETYKSGLMTAPHLHYEVNLVKQEPGKQPSLVTETIPYFFKFPQNNEIKIPCSKQKSEVSINDDFIFFDKEKITEDDQVADNSDGEDNEEVDELSEMIPSENEKEQTAFYWDEESENTETKLSHGTKEGVSPEKI